MTGQDLKVIRKKLELTQFELALKLGFTPSHISMMETGRAPVMPVTAVAVSGLAALLRMAI